MIPTRWTTRCAQRTWSPTRRTTTSDLTAHRHTPVPLPPPGHRRFGHVQSTWCALECEVLPLRHASPSPVGFAPSSVPNSRPPLTLVLQISAWHPVLGRALPRSPHGGIDHPADALSEPLAISPPARHHLPTAAITRSGPFSTRSCRGLQLSGYDRSVRGIDAAQAPKPGWVPSGQRAMRRPVIHVEHLRPRDEFRRRIHPGSIPPQLRHRSSGGHYG